MAAVWTMKEALSKALRCGLTVPLNLLEVRAAVLQRDGSLRSEFSNFSQYKCQTWVVSPCVLSIALPLQLLMSACIVFSMLLLMLALYMHAV